MLLSHSIVVVAVVVVIVIMFPVVVATNGLKCLSFLMPCPVAFNHCCSCSQFVGNNPGLTKDALEMKRDQDLRRVDKEAKDYAKINEGLGEHMLFVKCLTVTKNDLGCMIVSLFISFACPVTRL